MNREWMEITKHINLCPNVFELTLKGQLVRNMKQAGQFLHILIPRTDLLLRRPISIAEIDSENMTCRIIYRAEGEGTRHLSQCKVGEKLDVIGPLGNGFPVEKRLSKDTVYLIGGGIGVPPLYELAKQLQACGSNVISFHGFSDKDAVFYESEFKEFGHVFVSTDNGTYGHKGSILETVAAQMENNPPSAVYACGPNGMLKAIDQLFDQHSEVYLSLEERMACGIGACYACVCPSKKDPNQTKKVCDEGPVFKKDEVKL